MPEVSTGNILKSFWCLNYEMSLQVWKMFHKTWDFRLVPKIMQLQS